MGVFGSIFPVSSITSSSGLTIVFLFGSSMKAGLYDEDDARFPAPLKNGD
jgi:hypothetical protein